MARKAAAATKAPSQDNEAAKAEATAKLMGLLSSLVSATPTKRRGTVMAEVTGYEDVVAEYVARSREIESLESLQEVAEETLKGPASDARLDLEGEKGEGIRSVVIKGKGDEFVRATWKDQFTDLDVALKAPLAEMFGDLFKVLFTTGTDVKLRDNADISALKEKLGDDFDKFFNESAEKLRFAKGAMDQRARLRKSDDPRANALDVLFNKYQYAASFNPPK